MYVIMVEAEKKGLRGTVNLVGGAKISFDFNSVGGETSFNCNTKNRTLMIWSGSTVVFTRKYIDCSSIQYIEVLERTN